MAICTVKQEISVIQNLENLENLEKIDFELSLPESVTLAAILVADFVFWRREVIFLEEVVYIFGGGRNLLDAATKSLHQFFSSSPATIL